MVTPSLKVWADPNLPADKCSSSEIPGINETVIYAVCTACPFLRVYSSIATDAGRLEACPACGGELVVRERDGRFPPAYVSRVSRDVLAAPELRDDRGLTQA